mmetsp:Transcript_36491/g.77621  ORF Transcript_36491/g.77621 Transcript_36491/m.77621 type:complete len:361 (+) Transcript_36491:309-1391(+)
MDSTEGKRSLGWMTAIAACTDNHVARAAASLVRSRKRRDRPGKMMMAGLSSSPQGGSPLYATQHRIGKEWLCLQEEVYQGVQLPAHTLHNHDAVGNCDKTSLQLYPVVASQVDETRERVAEAHFPQRHSTIDHGINEASHISDEPLGIDNATGVAGSSLHHELPSAVAVLRCDRMENLNEISPVPSREMDSKASIEDDKLRFLDTSFFVLVVAEMDVPRVKVAMNEVVAEQHFHVGVHADLAHCLSHFIWGNIFWELMALPTFGEFAHFLIEDSLQWHCAFKRLHQNCLVHEGPDDLREADRETSAVFVVFKILPKSLHVRCLDPHVGLRPNKCFQVAESFCQSKILCSRPDSLHRVKYA